MGKKSAAATASKISATETTGSSDKSSILRSSFAPSSLQLHLFASVIQSFESQQLRIHDTTNGRLRQQHSVPAGTEITCLDWGRYGPSYRELRASNKKKRKRNHENLEDVVVAYGTNKSEICMFSPSQGEIISVLRNGHDREVRDFKFHPCDNLEAWSIGGDGKLVQWDLQSDKVLRTIPLVDSSIQTLCWPSRTLPQIFCASVTPYAVHIESKDDFRIDAFDAFKQPVRSLFRPTESTKEKQDVLIAADNNRFLNVYDVSKKKIVRTLVVGGEIAHASLSQPVAKEDQILAVVTREGIVELFAKPFSFPSVVNGDIKAQRKQMTRRADASIKLVGADGSNQPVSASEAFIDGPNLIVASTEGGVEPVFQKIRWEDEGNGELLFDGVKEVPRAKLASTLNTATMNGAKDMGQVQVNEAKTVVINGLAESGSQSAPVEIESSDEEEEAEEDEDEQDEEIADEAGSDEASDEEMQDADAGVEGATADANEEGEPSFGDLLAARHPETISIANALAGNDKSLMKLPESKQLMLPSGMSLGTVLQQSLRTNDQSLLETCLHVTDEQIIQNTILRLDSSLAANLLGKLAERLADRPGRYGHLLTWVQSTMIAHGGAIASQAGVASKLRTLYQVLNERSRILPSILLLKGKLDMMKAQQSFRKQATDHRKGVENAETMIYVEGGEDNWSSDEDTNNGPAARKSKKAKKASRKDLDMLIARPESSDDEDVQMVNGGYHMDEDEEHESDEDAPHIHQPNGIVDDEAEVSGEDDEESGGDESDNSDDSEEDDEGDDEEEDSSMADFINDGEISVEDDNDNLDVDEGPARPAKKKSKHH